MKSLFTVEILEDHPKGKDHLPVSKGETCFVLLINHPKLPDERYFVEKEDGTSELLLLLLLFVPSCCFVVVCVAVVSVVVIVCSCVCTCLCCLCRCVVPLILCVESYMHVV